MVQDCTADLDIDLLLIHIAAAQHATVLAQWLPKLLVKKKSPTPGLNECEPANQLSSIKLQPQSGTHVPLLMGSGAVSQQSSTISAMYDVQAASASFEQLSSMTSMQTAASLTPAPSGARQPAKKGLSRILKHTKVSLKSVSTSLAIGGRDTISVQFDGWVTDLGETCKFRSLSVFMNGGSVIEALDLGVNLKMSREKVTGGNDLRAEVCCFPAAPRFSFHASTSVSQLTAPTIFFSTDSVSWYEFAFSCPEKSVFSSLIDRLCLSESCAHWEIDM
jgi:hypothetical protein